jgi:MipA family protein
LQAQSIHKDFRTQSCKGKRTIVTSRSPFKRESLNMQHIFIQGVSKLLVSLSLFSISAATYAQSADSPSPSITPIVTATPSLPLWEFGPSVIAVSQQAYPGSDTQVSRILPFPSFIYRGRYFRADRDSAGFRAVNTPNFEIDISAAGSFGANA